MRVILVAVECLEYDFLKECNTPNIDSLNPHPAMSYGSTTRAAVPAILGGLIPECICRCEEHKLKWVNPFFLTDLKRKTNLLLYINNGWVFELLTPFMPPWLRQKNLEWHQRHNYCPTEEMIDDFISRNLNNYFAYFHVIETHPPFYVPATKGKSVGEVNKYKTYNERRKEAVEWVDSQIGRLMELDYDAMVICADHALDHSFADDRGFRSFIACDIRNEKARYLWQL